MIADQGRFSCGIQSVSESAMPNSAKSQCRCALPLRFVRIGLADRNLHNAGAMLTRAGVLVGAKLAQELVDAVLVASKLHNFM